MYRVSKEDCIFSQFTATHPLHVGEQLIYARHLSVQSLLLARIFCTTNRSQVLARERWQNLRKFLAKYTIFIPEHPVAVANYIFECFP